MTAWIEDWFGSPYYSLLYKHRDTSEAKSFIDNLICILNLSSPMEILDCGCGRGRHSSYLGEKGFKVTGIDISPSSIEEARKYEYKNVQFFVHDMRYLFRINYYDVVLCLFTSFGYYDKDWENKKVVKALSAAAKLNGILVLDFLNTHKGIRNLVAYEKVTEGSISFEIHRYVDLGSIKKEITVSDKGKRSTFTETVKIYTLSDLRKMFSENYLEIIHECGDYHLTPFDEQTSDRLIIIGRKIK